MKLRNKKTGEIVACKEILILREDAEGIWQVGQGSSLAELNAEWEDYAPKEPLIKDEKIRKAVRTWATMNMLEKVEVEPPTVDCAIISFAYGMLRIDFYLGRSDISDGTYTIAELCGEEEE